jgi:hypothetical protein
MVAPKDKLVQVPERTDLGLAHPHIQQACSTVLKSAGGIDDLNAFNVDGQKLRRIFEVGCRGAPQTITYPHHGFLGYDPAPQVRKSV